MARVPYEDEIIISWVELHRDARFLSQELHKKGPWKGIIAVTRGGLVPAALVARELDIRLVDTICVTSYDSGAPGDAAQVQGDVRVLKGVAGDGEGYLLIDDLVDTGRTAQAVRQLLPKAYFATLYAAPAGRPIVDTFVKEFKQTKWIHFPGISSTASPRRSRTAGAPSQVHRLMILVIGNKNYSSWSLRPWLALKVFGFDFDEKRIPLYGEGAKEAILQFSPAGKVPVLVDGKTTVWDLLAILEYLGERNRKLWPADAAERAKARSLRRDALRVPPPAQPHEHERAQALSGKGRTPEVLAEIDRIKAMWNEARPFLFGPFTAVDAMYAPIVLLSHLRSRAARAARLYYDAMLELPAMKEWIAAAERETESIPQFDMYE